MLTKLEVAKNNKNRIVLNNINLLLYSVFFRFVRRTIDNALKPKIPMATIFGVLTGSVTLPLTKIRVVNAPVKPNNFAKNFSVSASDIT